MATKTAISLTELITLFTFTSGRRVLLSVAREFTVSCVQIVLLLRRNLFFAQRCWEMSSKQTQKSLLLTATSLGRETLGKEVSVCVICCTYSELRGESGRKPDVFSPSWSRCNAVLDWPYMRKVAERSFGVHGERERHSRRVGGM